MPGSHKKVAWKCDVCGYTWKARVYSIAAGHGCPLCSGFAVRSGYNDLQTKFPTLIQEWDYEKNSFLPNTIAVASNKKAWWLCSKCGYSWYASIYGRTQGRNCPACANRVLWREHNDLATRFPELVNEWDQSKNYKSPSEVGTGSSYRAWWICKKCGYLWQTKVIARTRGSGCPKCNQHRK